MRSEQRRTVGVGGGAVGGGAVGTVASRSAAAVRGRGRVCAADAAQVLHYILLNYRRLSCWVATCGADAALEEDLAEREQLWGVLEAVERAATARRLRLRLRMHPQLSRELLPDLLADLRPD